MLIALTLLPSLNFNLPLAKADDTTSSWTTMTPLPAARGGVGIAVVAGKIYVIGGLNENNQPVSTTEEYDPQTNGWTSKMPMPTPRSGFAITVYQNKIYCIGGTVGNGYIGNNEVFDPVSNTWETKTSMPTPRADLSANIVGDGIFLMGGKRYSNVRPFFNETNINEVYDPANDSWTTKTPIPMAVQAYASAVEEGKIYIMGGSLESLSLQNTVITEANQVYDAENDSWSSAAKMPNANTYGAAAATEGFMAPASIYCVGGFSGGEFTSKVQAYDWKNNSWSQAESMPTARAYLGAAIVNDVLYAIGGFDGTNWLAVNEQFKPVGYGTVPPMIQITSPENKTYSQVQLAFTINRGTQWMGYSIDNKVNITVAAETNLMNLSQGIHNVTMYANDTFGNMGVSNTAFFSVDTLPPSVGILLPQNRTYDTVDVQLTFTLNEGITYLAYSLDGQQPVKINGNLTLPALANGPHSLTVYAVDEVGNAAQKTVSFNIAPFPVVTYVAVATVITIILAACYLFVKQKIKK
jgi:N-acetylneuraminic acid mutarotase